MHLQRVISDVGPKKKPKFRWNFTQDQIQRVRGLKSPPPKKKNVYPTNKNA